MDHFLSFLESIDLTVTAKQPFIEALTHTSAKKKYNHERLEFLGDAVLRLAATEFIDCHHPELNVGQCSQLRSHLVSDQWLANLGQSIQIEKWLTLGPSALNDEHARETIRSETTEALIGAIYLQHQNLESLHRWLTPYWQATTTEITKNPLHFNSKSLLQEWSQARKLGLPLYTTTERSRHHGDRQRFRSAVEITGHVKAEAWGPSRKEAELRAAEAALQELKER